MMAAPLKDMRTTLQKTIDTLENPPPRWRVYADYDINSMRWIPRKIELSNSNPTTKTFIIEDAIDEMDAYKKFMEQVNNEQGR